MAFAIIKTGGRQHRVAEGDIIDVDFLDAEVGKEGVFADVLFHGDGDNITHGAPLIEGATVTGEVLEQRKDKKVIAFKYRRRKGYHRTGRASSEADARQNHGDQPRLIFEQVISHSHGS
jgi:large subunit ribosomal protein L21